MTCAISLVTELGLHRKNLPGDWTSPVCKRLHTSCLDKEVGFNQNRACTNTIDTRCSVGQQGHHCKPDRHCQSYCNILSWQRHQSSCTEFFSAAQLATPEKVIEVAATLTAPTILTERHCSVITPASNNIINYATSPQMSARGRSVHKAIMHSTTSQGDTTMLDESHEDCMDMENSSPKLAKRTQEEKEATPGTSSKRTKSFSAGINAAPQEFWLGLLAMEKPAIEMGVKEESCKEPGGVADKVEKGFSAVETAGIQNTIQISPVFSVTCFCIVILLQ